MLKSPVHPLVSTLARLACRGLDANDPPRKKEPSLEAREVVSYDQASKEQGQIGLVPRNTCCR
jgi:hypothetical protein